MPLPQKEAGGDQPAPPWQSEGTLLALSEGSMWGTGGMATGWQRAQSGGAGVKEQ